VKWLVKPMTIDNSPLAREAATRGTSRKFFSWVLGACLGAVLTVVLVGLQPGDVLIQGQKVSIHLPAAEVFSTRIDNAKTKVYSRDTGLFSSPDPDLESQVREEAERQLQQDALQDGILKTAGDNARSTISGMLMGLGFHEVDFR
jgi:hypothetical protein